MKKYLKLVAIALCAILLVGCTNMKEEVKEETVVNSAIESLGEEVKEDTAAVLINYATDEITEKVTNVTPVRLIEFEEERGLLVPYYVGSKVTIYELEYDTEENVLNRKEAVYEGVTTEDSALDLRIFRPDVIPANEIVIEYQGKTYSLILYMNGKDGTPEKEYVTLENNK